ncbi:hypothetical protein B0H13DRAFT_1853472 [Mycena leptocephala]|nr:hypothetical protein B0H13DRAFT_1853472 [Mycena leptocephala]
MVSPKNHFIGLFRAITTSAEQLEIKASVTGLAKNTRNEIQEAIPRITSLSTWDGKSTTLEKHNNTAWKSINLLSKCRLFLRQSFVDGSYDPESGRYGRNTPTRQQEEFTHDVETQEQTVARQLRYMFDIPEFAELSAHYATSNHFRLSQSKDSRVHKTQHITAGVWVRPLVPALSQEMLDITRQLPAWSDTDNRSKQEYHNFFLNYGTHIVLGLALGGMLRIVTHVQQDIESVGIETRIGADSNIPRVHGSIGVGSNHVKSQGVQDNRAHENIRIFCDGGIAMKDELTSILEQHFKKQPGYLSPFTYSWPGGDTRSKWIKALENNPTFCPDNGHVR